MNERNRSGTRDVGGPVIIGLSLIVFMVRLFMIDWNRGEFTDAIMQIELFENGNGYFLPLFTVLVKILSPIFNGPVWAGRFISIVSISLIPYLLWRLGREYWGREASLLAAILYLALPVPWRWSLYSMTDALFAVLFTCSIMLLFVPTEKFPRVLQWSIFIGGISCLARYQGLILLPLAFTRCPALSKCRAPSAPSLRWRDIWIAIPWVVFILWVIFWGSVHAKQFAERADSVNSLMPSSLQFALSFLRYFPCATGYLFIIFCMVGVVSAFTKKPSSGRRYRITSLVSMCVFIVWLIVHARFKSFQYRYFLPLLGPACLFAGYGITQVSRLIRIRVVLVALAAATVIESGWVTVRVLTGTRNAFADVREAGEYLGSADFQRDLKGMGIPENTPIYSNEAYNRDYAYPVKLRFWSGRGDIQLATLDPQGGYILCWHNVYAGVPGIAAFESFCSRTGAKEIHPPFVAVNIPRLPTIMVDPFPHSTSMPRAMEHREAPQRYETRIVYVPETKSQVSGTSARLGIQ